MSEPSVSLRQQDGGMSVRAFAEREGLSLEQAKRYAKLGKILGARQDARSKHWWIYPPAKLLFEPRSRKVRSAEPSPLAHAETPDLLTCGSAVAGEAGTESGRYAPQVEAAEAGGVRPPAGRQASGGCGASKPEAYTCPEVQSVLRAIREAAARQLREGVHYLRLEGREFAQLYAALDHDRSRVRKLVGKGLLPVGLLRASDSVWQKMQAMCRQGRLL